MDPADNSSEMAKVWRTHNLNRAAGVLSNSMNGSLKRGGLILKQAMQKRAPVWTGRMTRSTSLGPVVFKDGTYSLLVGPTVEYAKYTELEPWIIGKRPGLKSVAKGATIPWMRPAADDVADEVRDIILKGMSATVKNLQQGLGSI